MKLTQFNGGLDTRRHPMFLAANQGVVYSNIDNIPGHFKPIKDKVDRTDILGVEGVKDFGFYFEQANEAYFTDTPNDWVVFQNTLYTADRVGKPKKRIGYQEFQNLGIDAPTAAPTLTPVGTIQTGIVQYAVTFYNSTDGSESAPVLSEEITWHSSGIQLTNIQQSSDPQVNQIRIYRVGRDLTVFSLVVALAHGTTSYTDNTPDIDIPGTQLRSQTWSPAPVGLKYMVEANAMLFGAVGSRLYFTPIAIPYAWPQTYYLQMANEITGIAIIPMGLLVMTEHATTLVTGSGPTSLAQQVLTKDQGCRTHDSIVNVQGAAIWVSNDGICASSGGQVTVISKAALGKTDLTVVSATVFDEMYICQLADKSSLVWDFAYGSLPKRWNYEIVSLIVANDKLYGLANQRIYELAAATAFKEAHFKSGWITFQDITLEKVHDRFKIAYRGNIQVTITVDGKNSQTWSFSSADFAVKLVKFNSLLTRAYYVEIEIKGTGEVFELDFMEASANV